MVHNAVEYGMMAAISDGLSIVKQADAGQPDRADQEVDAASPGLDQHSGRVSDSGEGRCTCPARGGSGR